MKLLKKLSRKFQENSNKLYENFELTFTKFSRKITKIEYSKFFLKISRKFKIF